MSTRWLDLNQPLTTAVHRDQEVRRNVGAAYERQVFRRTIEQLMLEDIARRSGSKGLLLDVLYERTGREHLRRGRFELPLAANRAAEPLARHQ
jgi:hypothetical protein